MYSYFSKIFFPLTLKSFAFCCLLQNGINSILLKRNKRGKYRKNIKKYKAFRFKINFKTLCKEKKNINNENFHYKINKKLKKKYLNYKIFLLFLKIFIFCLTSEADQELN